MSKQKRAKLALWMAVFALTSLVAATAIPALGAAQPNKLYTIDVAGPPPQTLGNANPSIAASSGDRTFIVRLTNATPGNSNFQSAIVNAPTSVGGQAINVKNATINGAFSSNNNASATLSWVDSNGVARCTKPAALTTCPAVSGMVKGKVYVQNVDTVKSANNLHQTIGFNITLTIPGVNGCVNANATPTWTAIPINGNSLSGDTFANNPNPPAGTGSNSGQTTQITSSCGIVFDPAPSANGAINTDITGVNGQNTTGPVVVKVVDGAGNPVDNASGSISIGTDSGPGNVTITGGDAQQIACSNGVCSATFAHLQGSAIGTYTVRAHSVQYGDTTTSSFKLFEYGRCNNDPIVEGNVTTTNLSDTCALFTTTFDGHVLNIDKPTGEQVLLMVEVDAFDPEAVVYPVPATKVSPPLPAHPGIWCTINTTTGDFEVPGSTESWCLESQSTVAYGPDGDGSQGNPDWVPNYEGPLMQVTETWLLDGDAALCRKSSCN